MAMPQAIIRHPSDRDLKAIVAIYASCFPGRVVEVFGRGNWGVFIADYLRFYLAWDPANSWVCEDDGHVVGVIIAPGRYQPVRVALARGQLFSWVWHLLTG